VGPRRQPLGFPDGREENEVTDDAVRLDEPAELLDFRIADGEVRRLMDGDAPIEGLRDGVVRVRVGSWREPAYRMIEGIHRDSVLAVRVPELDLDSDTTHDIRIEFLTGTSPLILISGETSVQRTTLRFVIDQAVGAVQESDWRDGRYMNLAEKTEFVGLWILTSRITEVELTVRLALEDPEFSDDDLTSLRRYPERLAAAESSARSLRGEWPEAQSAEPAGRFPKIDIVPNPYGDLIGEAERDAKDAVGRMSGLISSQQIVLTQQQAQETRRFQRVATIVGATVLVPGLVAAVFGANVGFHGRGTSGAFWAMLLLMAGGAVATFALIRLFEAGAWRRISRSTLGQELAKVPTTTRLVILAGIGIALLAVGVAVLLGTSGSPRNSRRAKTAKQQGAEATDAQANDGPRPTLGSTRPSPYTEEETRQTNQPHR